VGVGKVEEGGDAVLEGGMGRKEPTAAVARDPSKPVERIDHYLGRITRASENIDTMSIGGIFFRTTIASSNQCSCNRCEGTATGKQSLQERRSDAQPGVQHFGSPPAPQILVRDLV